MLDVGYVVSSMIITGPERGAYKVWVPKKHGDPTTASSYSGFGTNLGNLGSLELYQVQQVAENYYPLMPLSSGGHMPFDENSGFVSANKVISNFETDNVPHVQNEVSTISNYRNQEGTGATYQFSQSRPGMNRVFTFEPTSGESVNIRQNTPSQSHCKLSLGTKVVVCDNFIIGQLPQTQNDLINQLRPVNQ